VAKTTGAHQRLKCISQPDGQIEVCVSVSVFVFDCVLYFFIPHIPAVVLHCCCCCSCCALCVPCSYTNSA